MNTGHVLQKVDKVRVKPRVKHVAGFTCCGGVSIDKIHGLAASQLAFMGRSAYTRTHFTGIGRVHSAALLFRLISI